MKTNIYLWTGNGAGKTTSALGVALRCAGQKKKAVIIQFMKGRKDIGEYKIRNKLKPYYEIHQFGTRQFINLKKPSCKDIENAYKGLVFAVQKAKNKPFIMIFDEINLAAAIGLLKIDDVVKAVKQISKNTIVYLTGRKAPRQLISLADFVNEIREVKKPRKYPARKGIEY
jgi:cob(I)alamin adenosyltransferase